MDVLNDFLYSEKYVFYRNVAAIFGTLVAGRIVFRTTHELVSGFRAFFLAPMGVGRMDLCKYGSWAVVTGASEGIGRGYALELAKRGLNVVLMSRSEEKLNRVAAEIKEIGRESLVIPVDFSGGLDIYTMISDQLKDVDIGVLVNNVGTNVKCPDIVGNSPAEMLYRIVQVNCQPVLQMSHIVLPKMVEKGGGIIVNVSSASALRTFPQQCVYSATKIYMNQLADIIRKEYRDKGIITQSVTSFYIATRLGGTRQTSFAIPGPVAFAKAAVATIGIQDTSFGCFNHALLGFFGHRSPQFVSDYISNSIQNESRRKYQFNLARKKEIAQLQ